MTFKKDEFNNESINELIISPDTDNDLAKVDQKFDVGIQPYNNPIHDKYRDPKPILLEPYSKAANMEIIPTEKDVEYRGVWVDSSEIEDKIDDFEEIKEDYYRIILDQNDNAPALDKVLEKLTNEEIIKAKYLLSTKIKKDNYDETILHVNENLRQEEIIFETKDAKFPRIFREIKFRVNVSFTDLGYMNFYRKDGTQIVYKRHDGRSLLYQTLPVIIARHKLNLELKEEQEIRDIVAADPDYYGLRFTSSRIGEAIPEPLSNFVGYILVHVVSTKPINLPRLFRTDALSIKDYLKEESLYRAKLTKYIEFWAKEVKPSNDDFIDNDVLNQKYQNELENFENMKNSTKQTVIDHIELLKSKIYDTFKQTQIAKDDFKDRYKTNIYENAFKISKLQYKKFWAKLGDLLRTRRSLRRKITYLLYILNKLDTLSKEDIEAKDLFRITNVFLLQNFPTKNINELNEHLPNVKIESLLLEKTGTTENFKRFESDLRFVINHENTFVDANIDDFGVFANKQIPTLNKNHTNNYINYYIQLVQNHKTTLSDALKASWYETLKYFKPSTEVTEILKPLFYRHVEQEITEFRLFKNMHSRDKFLIAWMDETVILDEPHPLWKAIVYPSYTIQTINKLNHRVEDIMHAAERMHTHTYKSQVRKYTREAKQKIINKYEHILKKYKTQKLKIIKLKKEQARSLQKITIKDQLYYNVYNENLVLQKNKYVNWEIRKLQNKVFKIVYKKINFGTEEKPLHYFFHIKKLEYVGNNYSFETREKKDNSTELVWKNIYKHLYTEKLFLEELNIRMEECHHTASQIMRKYNDLYHFNEIITSTEIKSTSKLLYVFYANLKMEKKQILANKIDFEELSEKLSPVKDYFEIYKMVDWDDKEDKALQEIENVKKQYSKLREEKTSWNMLKAYKNKQLRKHQQLTDEYIKEIKSTPTTYLFDEKAVVSMQHRTFPKLYKNIELANIIHLEILINYLYRHIFKALKILQRHYSKNSTQQKFKRKLYYHKQKEKKRVDKIKEKQEEIKAQFIYNEIQEEKELQKNLEKDRKVLEKKQKTINKEYKKNARGLKNWRIELNKELKASNKILKNLEGTPINDNKIQEEKEIQKAIEKDFKALEKQQNSLDEEYKKKQEELNIEEIELNKKFDDSNKVLKPLDEEYKKIQEIRSEKFKKQIEKIKKQNEKKKKE